MDYFVKKYLFIFSATAVLILPAQSMAEVSFQSTMPPPAGFNDILNNLPAPLTEFINSAKSISNSLNTELGKYVSTSPVQLPTNFNQVNQLNLTQWLQNALQNNSLSGIYSIAIKMVQVVGNMAIWILGIVTELIRQGLSLINR